MHQCLIHQYQGKQSLDDGGGPYADAGIMPPKGLYLHGLAPAIHRLTFDTNAGCWLDRYRYRQRLTRRDTTQYTACMIAQETIGGNFIAVFGPVLFNTS